MIEIRLSNLLRRDRSIVTLGIVFIMALSWGCIILMETAVDTGTIDMVMPRPTPWSLSYAFMIFIMWAVMMAAR